MTQVEKVFEPSHYAAGDAHGLLSPFEPGSRTLPAGSRSTPDFGPCPPTS